MSFKILNVRGITGRNSSAASGSLHNTSDMYDI